MNKLHVTALLAGVSLSVLGGQVWAAEAAPADASASSEVEEVVVTGSRIVRDGYTAPTPVTVASTAELVKSTPSNIPDALNKLPQFQNSSSPSRSAHNFANTAANGNVLNLRGLGGLRTLILFDGQRVPPTTFLGTVDTNVIPNLLISRVDIVTGGASAAYGSDAVSGVVNFVLDRKFTGLKGVAQYSTSEHGDNKGPRFGLAAGTDFADGRGHILASGEVYRSSGMLRSDRALGRAGYAFAGSTVGCVNPSPATNPTGCNPGGTLNPYGIFADVRISAASEYGKIVAGPAAFVNQRFTPTGTLVAFDNGRAIGTVGEQLGGDGYNISKDTQAVAPLKTYQSYGRVSYDLTSDITGFVQASFNRSDLKYTSLANSFTAPTSAVLYSGNPYLPAAIQSAFTPAIQSISVNRYGANEAKPVTSERTNFWEVTAGLEGKFGDNYKWAATYNHGHALFEVTQRGVWNWQRTFAALDAVRDPAGNTVCRVTQDADPAVRARFADCKPLNILVNGSAFTSQPGYAYALGDSAYDATNIQDDLAFNVQGALFELPAGPVDVAVGVEYRRQKLDLNSNADPSLLDTTAERNAYFSTIRGVPAGTSAAVPSGLGVPAGTFFYWLTNVGVAHGSQNVKEAFGEVAVPLLRDQAIAKELSLNGAARITDYSTSGTVKTWKVGATWKPVDDLLLRVTRSRDIRAPNLYELFAGDQAQISILNDPVSGINQNVPQVSGGNPNLTPEIADTFTIGGVVRPRFLPGFSMSFDYYDIKIDRAIGTLSLLQIVNNCFVGGPTAAECSLITRPSANAFPSQIRLAPANIAFQRTRGIDFDASYRTELAGGNLDVRLYASRLNKFETQQSATAPVLQFAGVNVVGSNPLAYPRWRGNLAADYSMGPWGVTVSEQYIGKMTLGIPGQPQNFVSSGVDSVFYTDLSVRYDVRTLGGTTTLFATVNNLFDKDPPLIPGITPGVNLPTNFSVYDTVGRAYTVGARFKF